MQTVQIIHSVTSIIRDRKDYATKCNKCIYSKFLLKQVTWLPILRSEAQASGWCCMCITFLQILLIFSSPEGYRLKFSSPHAYFVYTVWHCTGQHCSSQYACTYRLFAGTWHPLVSVITTQYIMLQLFFIVECGIARFLSAICVFEVWASSSSPRLPLCQI